MTSGYGIEQRQATLGPGPFSRKSLRHGFSRALTDGWLGEDGGESGSEVMGVGIRENKRRAQLEYVVVRTVGAHENALFAKPVDHIAGLPGGGGSRIAIDDEVNTEKKAGAADIADERVLCLESL